MDTLSPFSSMWLVMLELSIVSGSHVAVRRNQLLHVYVDNIYTEICFKLN